MNIYAPNVGAAKYISQLITEIKTRLDNTLIVGGFNMALSANDRSSKHNITKETRALNDTPVSYTHLTLPTKRIV